MADLHLLLGLAKCNYLGILKKNKFEKQSCSGCIFSSTPVGRSSGADPRAVRQDYVEDLSWSRLGFPPEHLTLCRGGSRCLEAPTQAACPTTPPRISRSKKNYIEAVPDTLFLISKATKVFQDAISVSNISQLHPLSTTIKS